MCRRARTRARRSFARDESADPDSGGLSRDADGGDGVAVAQATNRTLVAHHLASPPTVIPAKAATQLAPAQGDGWVPAFAGTTITRVGADDASVDVQSHTTRPNLSPGIPRKRRHLQLLFSDLSTYPGAVVFSPSVSSRGRKSTRTMRWHMREGGVRAPPGPCGCQRRGDPPYGRARSQTPRPEANAPHI